MLKRLNILLVPKGQGLTVEEKLIFLKDFASMGCRFNNPEMLDKVSKVFLKNYRNTIKTIKADKGGDVSYVSLFKNWQKRKESDLQYFKKRLIGYWGSQLNLFNTGIELKSGTKIPKWLFNVYDFGADPVTQMQSEELFKISVKEENSKVGDDTSEWTTLRLAFESEANIALENYFKNMMYSKSSIKEEYKVELVSMLNYFGVASLDKDLIVYKEIKAMLLKYLWTNNLYDELPSFCTSATDLLRMFAALTDTDVSLATEIKFPKFNRQQRKSVLNILENDFALAENLKLYQNLWLQIGRYLHPYEYKNRFPKTAEMFDLLRNGKLKTFASITEFYIANGDLKNLLKHLILKPGVFARKLHEVLRRFNAHENEIIDAFKTVIHKIALKNLLILKSYFQSINEQTNRAVVNKKGKLIVIENNSFLCLEESTLSKLVNCISKGIEDKYAEKENWNNKAVWIDPDLINYTIPFQQRKASDGMITVGRGSRINVDFDKVLRLFVYWKEAGKRTDLDLSVIQFDATFKYLGHVSYTNLRASGIVHSGDVQSAPYGAAEFIDISLSKLNKNVKYLAVDILKYGGNKFTEMDCHAGWMMRNKVDGSVKSFDVKTVQNKFDLNGVGSYAIPLIVDLNLKQIIVSDLFVKGKAKHNNVEGAISDVALICSEINKFTQTKPTLYDLSVYNAVCRKANIVHTKEEAEISFGKEDCSYNANDVAKILAELV